MQNSDMPAMPNIESTDCTGEVFQNNTFTGLTKREQFCLTMGVADTGDKELDKIITKGNRLRIAMAAMTGEQAARAGFETLGYQSFWSSDEYLREADELLKGLDK